MIAEALLANAAILFGLAMILWVVAVQIDDVSFVDAYWGGGDGCDGCGQLVTAV